MSSILRSAAPQAQRLRRWRWSDTRLWLGVVLIAVSVLIGSRVMATSEQTTTAWRATRDLAPGAAPAVEPVTVALGVLSDAYASGSVPPVGRMRVAVPAGTLLPADAVIVDPEPEHRLVTVGVEPLHAPVGLAAGDVVDVWASAADTGAARLVRSAVLVHEVAAELDGASGRLAIVLEVPPTDVGALVGAGHGSVLDLVLVPWPQGAA